MTENVASVFCEISIVLVKKQFVPTLVDLMVKGTQIFRNFCADALMGTFEHNSILSPDSTTFQLFNSLIPYYLEDQNISIVGRFSHAVYSLVKAASVAELSQSQLIPDMLKFQNITVVRDFITLLQCAMNTKNDEFLQYLCNVGVLTYLFSAYFDHLDWEIDEEMLETFDSDELKEKIINILAKMREYNSSYEVKVSYVKHRRGTKRKIDDDKEDES